MRVNLNGEYFAKYGGLIGGLITWDTVIETRTTIRGVRVAFPGSSLAMIEEIDDAKKNGGDLIGTSVNIDIAFTVPYNVLYISFFC